MSENKKMSMAAKIIVAASLVLVVLLFFGIGLRAYNNFGDTSGEIGYAKAEELVLKDAGLSAEEVSRMICSTDYDNGRMIYEIDFYTEEKEFEYDVDAKSGEILKRESEMRRNSKKEEQMSSQNTPVAASPDSGKNENTDGISEEKAKEIAISHAAVDASSVTHYKAKLDYENGVKVYEIDFRSGGYEYEYDINAKTGAIIKSDKDFND